jgi:hypothetical protein
VVGVAAEAGQQRLISASDLKRRRGWTEGLVTGLLGAPDALSPNPHGFRPPMRWYLEDRVADAERDETFAQRRRPGPDGDEAPRRYAPEDVEHLEWLGDPDRIALFHAPRRPRMRRRRPAPPPPPARRDPPLRFEVLRLFDC